MHVILIPTNQRKVTKNMFSNTDFQSEGPVKSKGRQRKEPWDEKVQRQERYHADMMQIQRDWMNEFEKIDDSLITRPKYFFFSKK